jgi:hypothetical protein
MKGIILVLTILLVNIKVKAADSFCWSELLDDPFPCCTKDDGPIEGENMEGSWGIENGQKCGYRSRYANWNLRDKFDDTREEWEAFKLKWDNKYRDNFERIAITPGEKESLLNFGWESTTEFEPSIRLSTSRDMENAKIFDGENEFYRKKDDVNYYSNKVTVSGLEPNSVYYYQRKLNNKWEDPVKFNTFDPDNFKFIFLGDPQIGGSIGRHHYHSSDYFDYAEAIRNDAFNWNITIFNSIKFTKTPSLILSAGDQADTMGDDITQEQQYSGLLLPELIKTIPFAPTLGNHEVFSESFRRHFNVPHPYIPKKYDDLDYVPAYNYYFKYNNVLVVVLESNHNSCHDCEIVMAKAVDKYPNTDWRIALFHHDIYGNGATHSQGDAKKLRPCLTGLFDIYKFDLVINGHDHVYTTTKFINYNNSNKKSYTLSEIKEGVTNKNPKGTFFITANCSSGSKFLDFTDKTLDYVFNSTQTFTSTFGVLDFKKESGKVKMIINIHEVETFKTIDGPFIFEKDAKEETEDDNKCWSNFLGYPCCKKTDDIIYNAVKGSWGYENNSWCGLDFTDAETCWAYPLGYACCRKTKIIQRIDKNGKKYGFESGGVCAFTDEDTDLEILTEDCKGLSEGYPCCSSLSMKTSGYDDQWGYEDNDWCRLTDEQELEYKENLKKCWAYARNYKCCSNPNTKVETEDKYGKWGIENNEWCGIDTNNITTSKPKSTTSTKTIQISTTKPKTTTTTTSTKKILTTPIKTTTTTTTTTTKKVQTTTTTTTTTKRIITTKVISTTTKALPTPSSCWAEELDDGYPCCKTTNVVIETDGNGEWGIENDQWCGIRKCWSLKLDEPYPCCVYATEIIYTNENGKWSMENGDWCGIIENAKPPVPVITTSRTTTRTTTTTRRTTTTSRKTTTTRTVTTTTTTSGSCSTPYGQCGGINYNGPTCCPSGYTCKFISDYYYQCTNDLYN